jgi:putative membrane protein
MMEVTLRNPLSQSLDRAVKHYASLFTLPSSRMIILLQALICIGGVTVSLGVFHGTLEGVADGFLFGGSIFLTSLVIDYLVNLLVLRRDSIYDLRRTGAVSLFCWGIWFFFSLLGIALGTVFGFVWWVRLSLFGFSIALILRLVVYRASASIGSARVLIAAYLHPFSCLLPFLVIWITVGYVVSLNMLLFLVFSPITAFLSTHLFLSLLNRVGEKWLDVPSLSLFRAFLLNWIVGYNAPFEELLERLSEEQNVEVSLVKFDSARPEAAIVVPAVHPGPFKNIGSSVLPCLLKAAVEKRLRYTTCVPLGAQGHELDLASQVQNRKVIQHTVAAMGFKAKEETASPLVKAVSGPATVYCQIFGTFALFSFTLAPCTTEDLPQELGLFVKQETEKCGLSHCVVINAHNSLDAKPMPEALTAMKEAAAVCLKKAVSLRQMPFEVGASTVTPKEFTLVDGMGAGGITVVVVKVGDQKAAYVVIDGNNMVSVLREKILSALASIGINEGEVFTTDTHSVSAVVLGKRGYHPVGEVMNHERLIGHIKEAAQKALTSLKLAKAGYESIVVPSVKVIGEKRLESLSLLTDRVLQRAKKIVVPIFATSGLFLMLFLLIV